MSKCYGCYFYKDDYMWNRCEYFQSEYYHEPNECEAFSVDGILTAEQEDEIFKATGGYFGEPLDKSLLTDNKEHDENDKPYFPGMPF